MNEQMKKYFTDTNELGLISFGVSLALFTIDSKYILMYLSALLITSILTISMLIKYKKIPEVNQSLPIFEALKLTIQHGAIFLIGTFSLLAISLGGIFEYAYSVFK